MPGPDDPRPLTTTAEAGTLTAAERPNPISSVTPGYNATTHIPSPWFVTPTLDLPIETAGKLGYRVARARHRSEAARLHLATVARQVRGRLRQTLVNLYTASDSALRLEVARQFLDLHLSPGYEFDQGDHTWSLGLSVTLPVPNRNQGPIAEAEARRAETAALFNALQDPVLGELDRTTAAYHAALAKAATTGTQYAARQEARRRLLTLSALALAGILVLLLADFQSLRLMLLVALTLPFALFGGVLAAWFSGGVLSLGSLVGFVTSILFNLLILPALFLRFGRAKAAA